MIVKLAQRGGVMGINFAADFLDENDRQDALSKNIINGETYYIYIRDRLELTVLD